MVAHGGGCASFTVNNASAVCSVILEVDAAVIAQRVTMRSASATGETAFPEVRSPASNRSVSCPTRLSWLRCCFSTPACQPLSDCDMWSPSQASCVPPARGVNHRTCDCRAQRFRWRLQTCGSR